MGSGRHYFHTLAAVNPMRVIKTTNTGNDMHSTIPPVNSSLWPEVTYMHSPPWYPLIHDSHLMQCSTRLLMDVGIYKQGTLFIK